MGTVAAFDDAVAAFGTVAVIDAHSEAAIDFSELFAPPKNVEHQPPLLMSYSCGLKTYHGD